MIKKGNETCKSRLKPKKLTGEERGLNAENEKREEDGGTDQMEKSESHPIGRGPVWRMKSSHDLDSKMISKRLSCRSLQ